MTEPIYEALSTVETWQATCSFRWYTRSESDLYDPSVAYWTTVLQQAWVSDAGNVQWQDVPYVHEGEADGEG